MTGQKVDCYCLQKNDEVQLFRKKTVELLVFNSRAVISNSQPSADEVLPHQRCRSRSIKDYGAVKSQGTWRHAVTDSQVNHILCMTVSVLGLPQSIMLAVDTDIHACATYSLR